MLFISLLGCSLISVSALARHGYRSSFDDEGCVITPKGKDEVLFSAPLEDYFVVAFLPLRLLMCALFSAEQARVTDHALPSPRNSDAVEISRVCSNNALPSPPLLTLRAIANPMSPQYIMHHRTNHHGRSKRKHFLFGL